MSEKAITTTINSDTVLNGLSSYDPDGSIVNWTWDLGNDETKYGAVITHRYLRSGNYTINLTVKDDDNLTNTTQSNVMVTKKTGVMMPPVAMISLGGSGGNISFSGFKSYDENGEITRYSWTFGDGDSAEGMNVTHQYTEGEYIVVLEVFDDEGLSDMDVAMVSINYSTPPDITIVNNTTHVGGNVTIYNQTIGNIPPNISAAYNIIDERDGRVEFTGSGTDPDGTITRYQWDFDADGTIDYTSQTTGDTTHTYEENGTYIALFKVTDNNETTTVSIFRVQIGDIGGGGDGEKTKEIIRQPDWLVIVIIAVVAIAMGAVAGLVASKMMVKGEREGAGEVSELREMIAQGKQYDLELEEAERILRDMEERDERG